MAAAALVAAPDSGGYRKLESVTRRTSCRTGTRTAAAKEFNLALPDGISLEVARENKQSWRLLVWPKF